MGSPTSRKKIRHRASLLWTRWEKLVLANKDRVALIEPGSGEEWTTGRLTEEALKLAEPLSCFERGIKIAFCLPNGSRWMSLFLALQKLGLTAVPLDSSLPEAACAEMAKSLGCSALDFHGTIHSLEKYRAKSGTICCIKVTSGTGGGSPKTVSCRAEHLIADGTNIIRTMGIRPNDRNLAAIPLGHSYGLGNFVMPLILQGTAVVCAGRFMPRQIVDWIEQYRVTVFPSVPAIFRVLAALPTESLLNPLRLAISAGAPLTAEVAQTFYQRYGVKIHNFYGSSETGGICYDRQGNATLKGRSVGKPLTGVTVTVQRDVIHVASAAVAKRAGNWRMPDRGEWSERGELVLLGRRGREVNIGGKKVHPSEIEQALRTVKGVSDAIVCVMKTSARDILNVAVETRLSVGDVQRALAAKLPEWKLPKHYLIKPELPRTARGKIDITALRKVFDSAALPK